MMSPGVTRPLLAPIRSRLSALRRGTWMPTERLVMRHVRDVMRLKAAGMPSREIARRVGAAPSTVRLTIRRFEASGLTWPLPDDVTDTVLEARLFAKAGSGGRQGQRRLTEPDWAVVHRELKRKHVTLSIVWEEYIAGEPGGYRYSRFCELYRAWEGRLSVTMRQSHAAGDKLFVDYAGDGQHQSRSDQGLPLRSADQPQLRRHGGALRHRHSVGQAAAAKGQGEGRAGGPHGRALAAWAAAPPHLPQPRRGQCGDRRDAHPAQRGAADPAARRDPPQAVGGD